MTQGIPSKNNLKALALPLQQFISSWGLRERPSTPKAATYGHTGLPPPYELAALRGEGVLRERFFDHFIARLPVTLDAQQTIDAWQSLVEEGGYIVAWVERLGIAKALRREAVFPTLDPKQIRHESRKLYALLIEALRQQAPELLPWAIEGYFWHCWKQQFPSTAKKVVTTSDADLQRAHLLLKLRKQHGNHTEIKESFVQLPDKVQFAVLWRKTASDPWETLHQVERPRLKTARLAAYGEVVNH